MPVVALAVLGLVSTPSASQADATYSETTGGVANTWTNYTNAGGTAGPQIGSNVTVQIACKLTGFRVANGNTWWYRIASSPWNYAFYVSADAFYNNGATSGSLAGTPYVDPAVPDCAASSGINETTGGVTNTWTNYTNAGGTAGAQISSNFTVQVACKLRGFAVANGNTWWYRIASSPWNSSFYASADAFYNNGATSGSLVGTPYVDPAVPDCSGGVGGGVLTPTVSLSRGPAAPAGYRYAISLSGFAANSLVRITCHDSVSPNGFHTFSLTTNASGGASTSSYCYSGDGPDHWVVANGRIASNHVSWSAGSSGPGSGSTGGGTTGQSPVVIPAPNCPKAPTSVSPNDKFVFDVMPKQPRTNAHRATDIKLQTLAVGGILAKAGPVSYKLLNHYLGATGSTYRVDINALLSDQPPLLSSLDYYLRTGSTQALNELKKTPSTSCATASIGSGDRGYVITDRRDWYYALRSFNYQLAGTMWIGPADQTGDRPIKIVYQALIADSYNFNSDDPTFGQFEQLAKDGWAADFKVTGRTGTFTIPTSSRRFRTNGLGVPVP